MRLKMTLYAITYLLISFLTHPCIAAEISFTEEFDSYTTQQDMVDAGWRFNMINYSGTGWDINFDTPGRLTVDTLYHGTENYNSNDPGRMISYMIYNFPSVIDGDFSLTMHCGWVMSNVNQTMQFALSMQNWNQSYVSLYDYSLTTTGFYNLRLYDQQQAQIENMGTGGVVMSSSPETVFTISRENGLMSTSISVNGVVLYSIVDVPNTNEFGLFWILFGVIEDNNPEYIFVDSVEFTGESSTYEPIVVPEPATLISLLIALSCSAIRFKKS